AGVQAVAHVDAERLHSAGDRSGATDRARRAVECRQEPVAEPLHLMAAKPPDLLAYHCVVTVEQVTPLPVTKLRSAPGRVDDVSEHDCRQNAIDLDLDTRAG